MFSKMRFGTRRSGILFYFMQSSNNINRCIPRYLRVSSWTLRQLKMKRINRKFSKNNLEPPINRQSSHWQKGAQSDQLIFLKNKNNSLFRKNPRNDHFQKMNLLHFSRICKRSHHIVILKKLIRK